MLEEHLNSTQDIMDSIQKISYAVKARGQNRQRETREEQLQKENEILKKKLRDVERELADMVIITEASKTDTKKKS